jgi:hybrid cluster-associated redox disulfide protein
MGQQESLRGDLLGMKLDHLLSRWPAAAQVLIAYRMACIGCDFARFHTTNQALEVYDLKPGPFLQDLEISLQALPSNDSSQMEKE